MRAQVYLQVSLAFSQAALPARSLRKAGRLRLSLGQGYVTQLTVEQGFTEPSTYCTQGEGVLFNKVLYREAPPRGPTP